MKNLKIGDRTFTQMATRSEIRAVPLRHAKRVCDQRTYLNLELNLELDLHLNLTEMPKNFEKLMKNP